MPIANYTKKKPTKVAMGDKPKDTGYTKSSGSASQKRNCKAVGGKWDSRAGKCIGGAA